MRQRLFKGVDSDFFVFYLRLREKQNLTSRLGSMHTQPAQLFITARLFMDEAGERLWRWVTIQYPPFPFSTSHKADVKNRNHKVSDFI